ncbi:MAG: hypothetical protein WBN16_05230 [Lutimonas sp.]
MASIKIKKSMYKYFLIILLLIPCISCDAIVDDVLNCSYRKAELQKKVLRTGKVDQNYVDSIKASVNNEPGDEDYPYNFSVYGDLPNGIYVEVHRNRLDLIGVPTEPGTFKFKIEVNVSFGYEPTCYSTTDRSYTITITE